MRKRAVAGFLGAAWGQGHCRCRLGALLGVLVIVAATFGCGEGEKQSPGVRREIRDGVEYVYNPAEPLEGVKYYRMEEVWRWEAEDDTGGLRFGCITDARVGPDGTFYLLDLGLKTVHVVSPQGKLLRRLGRPGEGPGELKSAQALFWFSEDTLGVVQGNDRLVLLPVDGTVGTTLIPVKDSNEVLVGLEVGCTCGDLMAFSGWNARVFPAKREVRVGAFLRFHKRNGDLVSIPIESSFRYKKGETVRNESEGNSFYNLAAVGGRFFVGPYFDKYEILVFDSKGRLEQIITRPYKHVPRTEERIQHAKERLIQDLPGIRDAEVFPFRRDLRGFSAVDGELWVETSRGWHCQSDSVAVSLDVIARDGTYVRKVSVLKSFDLNERNDLAVFLDGGFVIVVKDWVALAYGSRGYHLSTFENYESKPEVLCVKLVPVGA